MKPGLPFAVIVTNSPQLNHCEVDAQMRKHGIEDWVLYELPGTYDADNLIHDIEVLCNSIEIQPTKKEIDDGEDFTGE